MISNAAQKSKGHSKASSAKNGMPCREVESGVSGRNRDGERVSGRGVRRGRGSGDGASGAG